MATQKRNDELVNMLSADFQKRCESSFAWKTACSLIQGLPGVRGLWPMSAFNSTGGTIDLSGQNRTLTYNGNPLYQYDSMAPYIQFDGAGDYLTRLTEAGLDITGTETYIAAGHRGITLGGWFRPENIAVAQWLISKWHTIGQKSYTLTLQGAVAGDPIRFYISDDGTANSSVTSASGITANTWQFFAARFNDALPGTELAIWLNDEMTTAATARAAIFNGTDTFAIGAAGDGVAPYTGRASLCFLSAAALSDSTVWAIYQHTRALFKV